MSKGYRKHQVDREILENLFISEKLSIRKIAVKLGIPKTSVEVLLKDAGLLIPLKGRNAKLELIGQRFGKLLVIKEDDTGFSRKIARREFYWHCQCDCGKITIVSTTALRSRHTASCGCAHYRRNKHSPLYKGFEEVTGTYINQIKHSAKARKMAFNLSPKYLWELFIKQERKCALSGITLEFPQLGTENGTASLDRIDSSKGYDEENVQWVHKAVNLMKWDFDQDEFIEWCKKIVFKNESINRL